MKVLNLLKSFQGAPGNNNNYAQTSQYPPSAQTSQQAPIPANGQAEYGAQYYATQGHYPNYHNNYYVSSTQPALTATSGSQVTYQLQEPPNEAIGEIKYTIDDTDR